MKAASLGYSLTEPQERALQVALGAFLKLSGAESALVADYGGNLITSCNPENATDVSPHTMGALAAGAFSATRELAALIREPGFQAMVHQGERHSLYLQGVGREFIVLVVFNPKTTVGLVKLFASKLVVEIEPLLQEAAQQPMSGGESFAICDGAVFHGEALKQ